MNDGRPLLDATEVVQNSLKLMFEARAPRRVLKADDIAVFLVHRWNVDDAARPGDPFWLTPPGALEPVELTDLIAHLLTGQLPTGWSVRRNAIAAPMTFGERSHLLQAVAQAASSWNMERGRLHPGLDEILAIFSSLVRAIGDGRHFAPGDVELTWQTLERLILELCGFPFAPDDLDTVLDVGRAFELWTRFGLSLPRQLPRSSAPLIEALFKLARQARLLLASDLETSTHFTDLIDGALLPWSRVADELAPTLDPPISLSLALRRFGQGARVRHGIRVGALSTFALDFDRELGVPLASPIESIKGPYSFAAAVETGAGLSGILARLTARRRNEAPAPVTSSPQEEWTNTTPQPFRILELTP